MKWLHVSNPLHQFSIAGSYCDGGAGAGLPARWRRCAVSSGLPLAEIGIFAAPSPRSAVHNTAIG